MTRESRRIVAELIAQMPSLVVEETDYGFTVGIANPTAGRAIFVQRVHRDDDPVTIYQMSIESVPEAAEYLRGAEQ